MENKYFLEKNHCVRKLSSAVRASGAILKKSSSLSQVYISQPAQFSSSFSIQHLRISQTSQWENFCSSERQPLQLISSSLISVLYIADHSLATSTRLLSSSSFVAIYAPHVEQSNPQHAIKLLFPSINSYSPFCKKTFYHNYLIYI